MESRNWGLRLRCRVGGLGCWDWGLRVGIWGLLRDSGIRVQGLGVSLVVWDLEVKVEVLLGV